MRSRPLLVVLLIAAVLVIALLVQHRHGILYRLRHHSLVVNSPPRGVLDVGERLPAVTFATLDGSSTAITARPGRVLFLDVFTTWCPDCINETPALEQLRRATTAQPVDIVGLDQQEDAATINQFIARFGLTYPILIDEDNVTQRSFGVHYIPVAYVIDSKGVVRGHIIGPQTFAEMKRLVDDVLHERPVGFRS